MHNIFYVAAMMWWSINCFSANCYNVMSRYLADGSVVRAELPHVHDGLIRNGAYIVPNESNTYRFFSGHDSKSKVPPHVWKSLEGLHLSLGTIRSLVAHSYAVERTGVTHLLMVDYDEKTVEFNRAHLELIVDVSAMHEEVWLQRLEYIARLHGYQLADIDDSFRAKHLIATIRDLVLDDIMKRRKVTAITKWNYAEALEPIVLANTMLANRTMENMLRYINNDGFTYYWDDDERWTTMVNAINDERISVVAGSLTDIENFVPQLKVLSTKLDLPIGILDISNAQYVQESCKILDPQMLLFTKGSVDHWTYNAEARKE